MSVEQRGQPNPLIAFWHDHSIVSCFQTKNFLTYERLKEAIIVEPVSHSMSSDLSSDLKFNTFEIRDR